MKILNKLKRVIASVSMLTLLATFIAPLASAQEDPGPDPMENPIAYVDRNGDNFNKITVGFTQDMSENPGVIDTAIYKLKHNELNVEPSNVVRLGGYEVELDFLGLLGEDEVACGYEGDILEIMDEAQNVHSFDINCMMDDMGGFFGQDVVINEVVTAPQGGGYEFIELRVNKKGIDLTGKEINVYRGGFGSNEVHVIRCEFTSSSSCANNPEGQGKANTVQYVTTSGGSLADTMEGDFVILKSFTSELEDNDYLELYSPNEYMVEDSLALGDFDDGYTGDNAPAGTSTSIEDQAIGR